MRNLRTRVLGIIQVLEFGVQSEKKKSEVKQKHKKMDSGNTYHIFQKNILFLKNVFSVISQLGDVTCLHILSLGLISK